MLKPFSNLVPDPVVTVDVTIATDGTQSESIDCAGFALIAVQLLSGDESVDMSFAAGTNADEMHPVQVYLWGGDEYVVVPFELPVGICDYIDLSCAPAPFRLGVPVLAVRTALSVAAPCTFRLFFRKLSRP